MKKILLFPLSLLLLFICLSCTRDVILKLDPAPPVLVLNASVTPEREVAAFLSKSWLSMSLLIKPVSTRTAGISVFRRTMSPGTSSTPRFLNPTFSSWRLIFSARVSTVSLCW